MAALPGRTWLFRSLSATLSDFCVVRLLLATSKAGVSILDRVTVLVSLLFEEEEANAEAEQSSAPDFFPIS